MTDLIYRLRYPAQSWTHQGGSHLDKEESATDMGEAADEIERLRTALEEVLRLADGAFASSWLTMPGAWERINDIRVKARTALAAVTIVDPHDHSPPCGGYDDCPYPDCLVDGACASVPNGERGTP